MITIKANRAQAILGFLQDRRTISTTEVSNSLECSIMTIRRDLVELESKGLIRRVHGGAVLASDRDPGYWLRHKQFQEEKRHIGALAASLLSNGQTVFLDTGTTTMEVARAILRRHLAGDLPRVRVITHAINIGAELSGYPNLSIYQIGGPTDPSTFGATGHIALQQFEELHFDMLFLGVSGIDLTAGLTNSNPTGVEVKRAAMQRTNKTIVVADSSKWQKVSFSAIAPLSAITSWISDPKLPAITKSFLSDHGVEVII